MDTLTKTMPQLSKLLSSRNDWRRKAVQRANDLREHRKTDKRLRAQIIELKQQVSDLQQSADAKKTDTDCAAHY